MVTFILKLQSFKVVMKIFSRFFLNIFLIFSQSLDCANTPVFLFYMKVGFKGVYFS